MELRDNGKSLEAAMALTCAVPSIGTRVPASYVVASALAKLSSWSTGGGPPPAAPHLTVRKIIPRPGQSEIARNEDGLAEGGIQLAAVAVLTELNIGLGSASHAAMDAGINGEAVVPGACIRWGYSVDFTVSQLNARYPAHSRYVAEVRRATAENLNQGFILPSDAAATIAAAEARVLGTLAACRTRLVV